MAFGLFLLFQLSNYRKVIRKTGDSLHANARTKLGGKGVRISCLPESGVYKPTFDSKEGRRSRKCSSNKHLRDLDV